MQWMKDSVSSISKDHASLIVLVVDSDSRALDLAASHIEYRIAGVHVSKAQSNGQARSYVKARRVDVLVLDCDGSRPDWNQLLSEFSRSCPDVKVVLTGRSPVQALGSEHILGVLQKPYLVDDLIALIESVSKPDRRYSCSLSNRT
jgi:DNA-binding NtrC family response regulator